MNCPSCGEFVRTGTAVCPYCAARVPIVDATPNPVPMALQPEPQKIANTTAKLMSCPNCREDTPIDSIKCRACGYILSRAKNEPNRPAPRYRSDTAKISGPTLICTKCGFSNIPERRTCRSCSAVLYSEEATPSHTTSSAVPISLAERKSNLDQEIVRQVRAGWLLITRTDTSAQMVSGRSGLLTSLLKRSESLYIEVDEFGNIRHTKV